MTSALHSQIFLASDYYGAQTGCYQNTSPWSAHSFIELTKDETHVMTYQSKLTAIQKFITRISNSEFMGCTLITACTALVWWNCYTDSLIAPTIVLLSLVATVAYAVAAALKTVSIVPESAIIGATRYGFILYMLLVNARHGQSPWWAYIITAAYITVIIIRIIKWQKSRHTRKARMEKTVNY